MCAATFRQLLLILDQPPIIDESYTVRRFYSRDAGYALDIAPPQFRGAELIVHAADFDPFGPERIRRLVVPCERIFIREQAFDLLWRLFREMDPDFPSMRHVRIPVASVPARLLTARDTRAGIARVRSCGHFLALLRQMPTWSAYDDVEAMEWTEIRERLGDAVVAVVQVLVTAHASGRDVWLRYQPGAGGRDAFDLRRR